MSVHLYTKTVSLNMSKNENEEVNGGKLLCAIANKDSDFEAARKAFYLFCSYFESKIKKNVEILAYKNGYDENAAFEAIQCAFYKVWLYPTFDMSKSNCKNEEKAIIVWLVRIACSQMYQYSKAGVCARVTKDEDLSVIDNSEKLSVIETSEDFVTSYVADLPLDRKIEFVRYLDEKMSKLDEKHRIIYLTYKAYQQSGKKLPRKLLDKLRKRLGVTQTTIRVYKKEACELLNDLNLLKV